MAKSSPPSDDFDSPWKDAVNVYLRFFLAFFFPDIETDLDWARGYQALDKEFQQIVRRAKVGKHLADRAQCMAAGRRRRAMPDDAQQLALAQRYPQQRARRPGLVGQVIQRAGQAAVLWRVNCHRNNSLVHVVLQCSKHLTSGRLFAFTSRNGLKFMIEKGFLNYPLNLWITLWETCLRTR